MLRLSDLQLPLDHTDEELHATILHKLGITADELQSFSLFKRSYDARKKHRPFKLTCAEPPTANRSAWRNTLGHLGDFGGLFGTPLVFV